MNFQDELNSRTREAEDILLLFLPREEGFRSRLAEACSYSLTAGGKRIRMLLMQETYRIFGGNEDVIRPFMAAMEMIHTHSLIHDDLPALDNDDYRRGRLTTHKVYGEAMGVLSGDALLNLAYETMLSGFGRTAFPERAVRAMQVIAEKTGIRGMLGGQSTDVENDGKPVDLPLLDYIYENKTAALLEAPLMAGAILAGADEDTVRSLEKTGSCLGAAFQIRDDILDVTSTTEVLGKPVHSDEKNQKTTYATLLGTEAAAQKVQELTEQAVSLLEGLSGDTAFLTAFVRSMASREK